MSLAIQNKYFAENFPTYDDIVGRVGSCIDLKDVCNAEQVCEAWKKAFSNDTVWTIRIDKDLFGGVEGHTKACKQVYRTLYTNTIGRALFRKWFGDVRKAPFFPKDIYDKAFTSNASDPFDSQKKLKEYPLILRVSHVYRPKDETLPQEVVMRTVVAKKTDEFLKSLRATGNYYSSYSTEAFEKFLISDSAKPESLYNTLMKKTIYSILMEGASEEDEPTIENDEMKIPLTLRNTKLLVETLYKGKLKIEVSDKVLKQCNGTAEKTGLCFMRKDGVLGEDTYELQKDKIEETTIEGIGKFELLPLLVKIHYNVIKSLETGKCPDEDKKGITSVRTANMVHVKGPDWRFRGGNDKDYPVCITCHPGDDITPTRYAVIEDVIGFHRMYKADALPAIPAGVQPQ
jgi:hypothetical protein